MANMPRLPGSVDINNPSYPTTSTPTKTDALSAAASKQVSMPPMPSLTSGFKLVDANSSAMDAVSAGNLPFQGTATDVLSQPMTTIASVCSSMVSLVSNVMTTSNAAAAMNMQIPGSISANSNANSQYIHALGNNP